MYAKKPAGQTEDTDTHPVVLDRYAPGALWTEPICWTHLCLTTISAPKRQAVAGLPSWWPQLSCVVSIFYVSHNLTDYKTNTERLFHL